MTRTVKITSAAVFLGAIGCVAYVWVLYHRFPEVHARSCLRVFRELRDRTVAETIPSSRYVDAIGVAEYIEGHYPVGTVLPETHPFAPAYEEQRRLEIEAIVVALRHATGLDHGTDWLRWKEAVATVGTNGQHQLPTSDGGRAESPQGSNNTARIRSIDWDLSDDRDANRFEWFDFDPVSGAIDGDVHLHLKFDERRSFDGDVTLIVFGRASDSATSLRSINVNLPPMTAQEVTDTLHQLASDWGLAPDRLNTDLPAMLSDSTRRGILLFERGDLDVDVEFGSSFSEARPFSLTISWFWDDGTL